MKITPHTYPALPVLFVASVLFLMFFSANTSPLYVGDWGDYSIYKYMGLGILEGKLPYLDLFDNKGPLLYAINALGLCVPAFGRWGLFALQTISLAFTLWVLYRLCCTLVAHGKALVATLVALLLLGGLYQGGDHVEEWMLPFISTCLYLALKLARNYNAKNLHRLALVGGVSVGCMLLLRPNDAAALGLGIATSVLIMAYNHRGDIGALRNVLVACAIALATVAVVLLPTVVLYAHHHALAHLWNGLVKTSAQMNHGWGGQLASLLKWGKWAVLLLMVALFVMAHGADRRLNPCLIPLCLAQLCFVGGKLYAHYLIVLFPMLVIYIALLWRQRHWQVAVLAVAIMLLSHRPLPRMMLLNAAECSHTVCRYRQAERSAAAQLLRALPQGATVWNYNLDPYNYQLAPLVENRVVQCNRLVDPWHVAYADEVDFAAVCPQYVVAVGDAFEADTLRARSYTLLGRTACGTDMRLYGKSSSR